MWQSPLPPTAKELSASERAQKEEIIKNFQAQQNDLIKKIEAAKKELADLLSDATGAHKAQLDKYSAIELNINKEINGLNHKTELHKIACEELNKREAALNDRIDQENQRVASNTARLTAKEDQLKSLETELNARQESHKVVEQSLDERHAQLQKKSTDLEQFTVAADKVTQDIVDKRHQLAADIETHEKNVEKHNEEVKSHSEEYEKLMAFKEALDARYKELDPLKARLQEGIDANTQMANSLKDKQIEIYQLKRDAEKRLDIAVQAEQRAKAEVEKLEGLKNDIHEKIKQEA